MLIRPETPDDYSAIAAVHTYAFGNHVGEATIVALHRQCADFDPELSVVVEMDGRVVGHALFTCHSVRLMGQSVQAVNLAPIGVHPAYQGRGIGGQLVWEGHSVARRKGYALSFLLGHSTYYPRFGYKTRAYGVSSLVVPVPGDAEMGDVEVRAPAPDDVPALWKLWRTEEKGVDFALDPGADLLDWISPNPAVSATVYLRGDTVVGYTRLHKEKPGRPLVFLAHGEDSARAMIAHLSERPGEEARLEEVCLPLHPYSLSSSYLGLPESKAWEAAMVCPLAPSPFDDYYAQVQAGERPPGRVTWPVQFDLS